MRYVHMLVAVMSLICLNGCAEELPPEQRKLLTQQALEKLLENNKPVQWDPAKPDGPYQITFYNRSNYLEYNQDEAANAWVARYGNEVTILKNTNTVAGTAGSTHPMVTVEYKVHPPK